MEDIVRSALEGFAIGGFTAALVKANLLALQVLWRFNRLAMETAFNIVRGLSLAEMVREMKRQQLAEDSANEADDEDED